MAKRLLGRIDYHPFKRAVNGYLARPAGGEQRPVFWDTDDVCPELHRLEEAFPQIRAEVDALFAKRTAMPSYHEISKPSTEIAATTEGRWNVFMLELLGHRMKENLARCPHTARALAGIPRRIQAFFSVLDPGKSVPLHEGPYLGYLRYHLGVRVPAENPPLIRVAGQPYTWKEGEGTIFDDSWPHEVENHCREPRVVLIVDVLRPLPLVPNLVNRAMLYGVAAPLYGRPVIKRARLRASASVTS
ncbi:MAG: aspartyl/asparaginyl beta-hydroxylase domain-containing protein [Gammaproteobacteria bacterium]